MERIYCARMTVLRDSLDTLMELLAVLEPPPTSWEDVDTGEAWVEMYDTDRSTLEERAQQMLNIIEDNAEIIMQNAKLDSNSPLCLSISSVPSVSKNSPPPTSSLREQSGGLQDPKQPSCEAIIPAQYVIERAYAVSKGKAIVCTEVGQHQMFAAQFYKHTQPRHFLSSGGLGTMGFGLPASIGAQFGKPNELVVLFAGDGAVQMNFQEVVVAVEHALPIKIIILNNGVLGMVRQWQEMFYKKHYSGVILTQTNRPPNEHIPQCSTASIGCAAQATEPVLPCRPRYLPDFVKLAQAHGANARRIEKIEDVDVALSEAFADRKTWILEFIVEQEGCVLPMVPPGKAHKDIITDFA